MARKQIKFKDARREYEYWLNYYISMIPAWGDQYVCKAEGVLQLASSIGLLTAPGEYDDTLNRIIKTRYPNYEEEAKTE
jgi:hypothetical protein